MNKIDALPYVSFYIDDTLSPRKKEDLLPDLKKVRLVGWQCGFEPLFVAIWSYLDVYIDDADAEEIAVDYLQEIGWFRNREETTPDYIL